MDLKSIKSFVDGIVKIGAKNILLFIIAILIVLMAVLLKKSDMFMIIKAPSNKTVKIEINDKTSQACLDAPSKQDSLLMLDVLSDKPYRAKEIKYIAIHTTDSGIPNKNSTIEYWRNFFFNKKYPGSAMYGYNYLVTKDKVLNLRPINKNTTLEKSEIVWGVKDFNSITVSIAYEGGRIFKNGKWVDKLDTRTERQKFLIDSLVTEIKKNVPNVIVQGHGKFPGVNKSCPNYKVS